MARSEPRRGKTDATDAEAICEAVTRPTMRFVAVKSREQQAAGLVFRTRDLVVRQRTQRSAFPRRTRDELGWEPQHLDLIDDIRNGSYFERYRHAQANL